MKLNSMSAASVTQPGGLYANINDGLLQGLMAYFTNQDRERQANRQMKRDEQVYGRQQLADALAHAERYGVRPRQQDSGLMAPGSDQLISGAVGQFNQRKAEQDRVIRQRLLADIEEDRASPSVDIDTLDVEQRLNMPVSLQEEIAAQSRGRAKRKAAAEQAAVKNEMLMAQAALMAEKAAGGGGGPGGSGSSRVGGGRGGGMSTAELETLRERANRYADAQGWTKYDYDQNGKPINRRVNPDDPDAYRRIMELEASLGLPGAAEVLAYDDENRKRAKNTAAPQAESGRPFDQLSPEDQAIVRAELQLRAQKRSAQAAGKPTGAMSNDDIYADDMPTNARGSSSAGFVRPDSRAAFDDDELGDYMQTRADEAYIGF